MSKISYSLTKSKITTGLHCHKKLWFDINKKIENFSINQKLIDFIEWFSMYNMVPRGLALKMCIGNGRNLFKKKEIYNI